jgi:hypothetical protein
MRTKLTALLLACALAAVAPHAQQGQRIQVVDVPEATRVDVTIDGQPFTSYLYDPDQKKPTLVPLRTAKGTVVTRGFPLEPRANERADHPHHIGFWFNYGDVNGLDFWNNSDAVRPDRVPAMGTVVHRRIVRATGGDDKGELEAEMHWVDSTDTALLTEHTRFVFRGDAASRSVDRITRLTALDQPVVLGDNKEGLLGIRVARWLEQPSSSPVVLTDGAGKPQAKAIDNEGVTGEYIGSDGKRGDDVWGTRGPWMMLGGRTGSEEVTLAILDHPANPGFPTYWHARGYGLFAANNLGQQAFDPKQPETKLTLKPGESVTFRHRVLVLNGAPDPQRMQAEHQKFAAEHLQTQN